MKRLDERTKTMSLLTKKKEITDFINNEIGDIIDLPYDIIETINYFAKDKGKLYICDNKIYGVKKDVHKKVYLEVTINEKEIKCLNTRFDGRSTERLILRKQEDGMILIQYLDLGNICNPENKLISHETKMIEFLYGKEKEFLHKYEFEKEEICLNKKNNIENGCSNYTKLSCIWGIEPHTLISSCVYSNHDDSSCNYETYSISDDFKPGIYQSRGVRLPISITAFESLDKDLFESFINKEIMIDELWTKHNEIKKKALK